MADLLDRYSDRIKGVLGCYDRLVIQATLPGICYAAGMTSLLKSRDIRVFDDTKSAEPLREAIRSNAETIAASAGINERAQAVADDFDVLQLHQRLDDLA
jgi:hypothetical protein